MLAPVLDLLNSLDPSHERFASIASTPLNNLDDTLHTVGLGRFQTIYKQVNAGWSFACRFANAGVQFPIPMTRKDHWVFAAYMMKREPRRFYNRHIADAYHIENPPPGMENIKSTIKTLILCYADDMTPEYHLNRVAERTGIPYASLEAFETLFYNVLDRRVDSICISLNLYPHPGGRMIEMNENYLRDSPMGKLLERAAHDTHDLDMAAYLSGIGDRTFLAKLSASPDRENELTNQIMGNGLLLARTNLLNLRSPGWARVATLLSAARQSGTHTEEPPLVDIGEHFYDVWLEAAHQSQEDVANYIREDEGYGPGYDAEGRPV